MEDLKFKIFGLINKQNAVKVPVMGLHPELLNPIESHRIARPKLDEATDFTIDNEPQPLPDQDVLESIETIYFHTEPPTDPSRHELQKLPDILSPEEIENSYKRLKLQQQVVSKKVLQLILQKQNSYEQEFQKILSIQSQLRQILEICRIGRNDLKLAKRQFTTASLGILANYRKRRVIEDLLDSLNTVKTLQRTGNRLQELLKQRNYPGVISLLLECQSAARTYKHFTCIAALDGKLQDILEQAEVALDATLSQMCAQFDKEVYSSVQQAYALLGKTQTAMDLLHMHFTAAIHNTAFSTVHSYVGGDTKTQYKQLCRLVPRDKCIACLTDLSKSLWTILESYYLVVVWHDARSPVVDRGTTPCEKEDSPDFSQTPFDDDYVKQKLRNSMMRIWHDVEMKISTYLTHTDLAYVKFEEFVRVLAIVNRLMEVGRELCDFQSENLRESIKRQSLSYFMHHHASRLDELRIFLENDGWELCPIKPGFVATQLQEFKTLKPALNDCKTLNNSGSLDGSNFTDADSSTNVEWLRRYFGGTSKATVTPNEGDNNDSPFTLGLDETQDEDILVDDRDDVPAYFSDDYSDDDPDDTAIARRKHKNKQCGPMVTNTTLSILRVCGRYLQMSRLLRSIAVTVIQSMIQFFELCFYTVHLFFTADLQINSDSLYSPKLRLTLARIRESLIVLESDLEEPTSSLNNINKVKQPHLSSTVDLTRPEKLHGLTERIVAVESLIFLGQQYESLKPYLEHLILDSPQRGFLHQFFLQTVAAATDLRKPVYMAVASQALDVATILALMNKVNWEVTDVMSQHSNYIDELLKEIHTLHERLREIGSRLPLSSEIHDSMWENVAHLITHTLVEGFSNAKKCSNGGRALMQLDFTQLRSKFEKIACLRPMPHREYVELYVKAYYLPEDSLEEWIKEHKEYSTKHLIGLVSSACQNNKKTRLRLISIVEERPGR
ncbi:syndetin isoform X2 [Prorops nasuta]|uniref:syndetin isoform X2 n=1 Tax=Prorops nasuta TaxID=863751 RepID=UPI0034CDAE43